MLMYYYVHVVLDRGRFNAIYCRWDKKALTLWLDLAYLSYLVSLKNIAPVHSKTHQGSNAFH